MVYQKCWQEAGLLRFYVNGHRIKLFEHLRRTEMVSTCNMNVSLKQSFESKLKTANCYNDRSDRLGQHLASSRGSVHKHPLSSVTSDSSNSSGTVSSLFHISYIYFIFNSFKEGCHSTS